MLVFLVPQAGCRLPIGAETDPRQIVRDNTLYAAIQAWHSADWQITIDRDHAPCSKRKKWLQQILSCSCFQYRKCCQICAGWNLMSTLNIFCSPPYRTHLFNLSICSITNTLIFESVIALISSCIIPRFESTSFNILFVVCHSPWLFTFRIMSSLSAFISSLSTSFGAGLKLTGCHFTYRK